MSEYTKDSPRSRMSMPHKKGYELMLRIHDHTSKGHKWVKNTIQYTNDLGYHYSDGIQILQVSGWLTIEEYNNSK